MSPQTAHPDPFAFFGLPRRFDVDLNAVRRASLQRLSEVHPDRAGGTGTGAEGSAAAVNAAREVLEDPERRAEVLLRLMVAGSPHEAVASETNLPPAFLAEVMEVREQVEEAAANADSTVLEHWEEWACQRRCDHIRTVGELFREAERGGDAGVFHRLRQELNKWRYTERLIEQLDPDRDQDGTGLAL